MKDNGVGEKKLLVARKMKDIDSCNLCQRIKNKIEIPVRKLKLSEGLERLYIVATAS